MARTSPRIDSSERLESKRPWCRPRPQKEQPPAQPRTTVNESRIMVKAGTCSLQEGCGARAKGRS
jgi:hypothetical protein